MSNPTDAEQVSVTEEEISKVISELAWLTWGDSDDWYSHSTVCEPAQNAIDLIKKLAERIGIETD